MENLTYISTSGWVAISFISSLIFIILMVHGIRLGWGNKSIQIGKKLDDKLTKMREEIDSETQKRGHDKHLQLILFKQCEYIDERLFADLFTTIKKIETSVYNIFKPFLKCTYPSKTVADIFEDILLEHLHYNNLRQNLTGYQQTGYIEGIIEEVHQAYNFFFDELHALHCGEQYPQWTLIKDAVTEVVKKWAKKCLELHLKACGDKLNIYRQNEGQFETEMLKQQAIIEPKKKNEDYIKIIKSGLQNL